MLTSHLFPFDPRALCVTGSSWDREAQPGAGKPLWEQHLSLELKGGGEGTGSCLSGRALQQQTGIFSWLVLCGDGGMVQELWRAHLGTGAVQGLV